MASQQNKEQLHEFIHGLGPGQLVGRQVLGSPVLGDIQISLVDKRGNLEVEVIRARGLQSKPGSKILPAPWVKVRTRFFFYILYFFGVILDNNGEGSDWQASQIFT